MRTAFFLVAFFISVSAFSQKDTTKPKMFYLNVALPETKWVELINMIKTADEKPSVVAQWIQLIQVNAKEIIKDSTKKK
jgi:hypothetical protein